MIPTTRVSIIQYSKTPLAAWWMLTVLLIYNILSFTDRYVLTMLVQPIKQDLHLSDVQMSFILGPAFAIAYALGAIPAGWAADRFPRRLIVYFGVTLWSISTTAVGLSRSFLALAITRAFVGFGEATLTPVAYPMLADRFPKRRLTLAFSIYQMGVKIGSAAAFTLGGLAIAWATRHGPIHLPLYGALAPWQMVLLLIGLPGALLALLVFTLSERDPETIGRQSADPAAFGPFLRENRALLLLMGGGFTLIALATFSYTAWVPTYMTRQFGWSPARYGPILGLIGLIGGASIVLKGWIVDLLFARGMKDAHLRFFGWLVLTGLLVGTAAFLVTSAPTFLALYGLLQAIALQYIVFLGATLQLITPSELRGRITGIFMAIFTAVGMGMGPPIVAAITDYGFGDEQRLGASLLIVTVTFFAGAFVLLRSALRFVRIIDQEPSLARG